MTLFGEAEHFSGRIGALRWSILVGKHSINNVQKPTESGKTRDPGNQATRLLITHYYGIAHYEYICLASIIFIYLCALQTEA